jgi:16S rRNA G966 N2-methylase RsmD
MINEQTWDFIRQHAADDVRKLALQGTKDGAVDLSMALQQIAGRQTALKKLPSWAAVERVLYPPHLNMEQCSSEQTARYKARLAGSGDMYVDLTGGLGVDFYWMSQGFKQRYYVERNAELCELVEHNFRTLGHGCSVCCSDTATYLPTVPHADVVFLDPARRNEHGGRTYDIKDCTPNILELLPLLMEKADKVILKLSPMLDWRKAVDDLQYVREVHIVSVDNECKELLLVLEQAERPLRLVCVNNNQIFEVSSHPSPLTSHPSPLTSEQFLYEPNASIMKAGCFDALAQQYPVCQVSANSHLFLSSVEIEDFPGRRFQICAISSTNKQALKETLASVSRANITVRNFPMSVEQLRKKLHLKDGGDTYIFATTKADGAHCLYICRKIG